MLTPLGPNSFSSAPVRAGETSAPHSASPAQSDGLAPSRDELTRDLQHRILMANINFELMRGSGRIEPAPPPTQDDHATAAPNGTSTLGILHDANLNMGVGDVNGPLTQAELWPSHEGYLIPRHNPWR